MGKKEWFTVNFDVDSGDYSRVFDEVKKAIDAKNEAFEKEIMAIFKDKKEEKMGPEDKIEIEFKCDYGGNFKDFMRVFEGSEEAKEVSDSIINEEKTEDHTWKIGDIVEFEDYNSKEFGIILCLDDAETKTKWAIMFASDGYIYSRPVTQIKFIKHNEYAQRQVISMKNVLNSYALTTFDVGDEVEFKVSEDLYKTSFLTKKGYILSDEIEFDDKIYFNIWCDGFIRLAKKDRIVKKTGKKSKELKAIFDEMKEGK